MTNWVERLTGETRAQLLRLLRRSRQTITALADAVGLTDNAVRTHVAALENGLFHGAGTEGRFPQVAGIRFVWDPAAEAGHRVRQVEVAQADALSWLRAPAPAHRFDVVFVDPPFAAALWPVVLEALPAVLADGAWLYLEGPAGAPPVTGADWSLHRAGSTRDTHYALHRFLGRSPAGAATLHGVPGTGGATPG